MPLRCLLPLAVLTALAACNPAIQTTSGADYLARAPIADPEIRAAAAIEPNLRLPARIGIARIEDGRITQAPPREAAQWQAFTERHAAMGAFVPISPQANDLSASNGADPLRRLRLAAARQHLDYLLVYELAAQGGPVGTTPFALADVTLVGGLVLPTRTTEAMATGTAAFVDVRNGYPYGTAVASEGLNGLARSYHGQEATRRLMDRAKQKVFDSLLPDAHGMMEALAQRAAR